MNPNDSSSKKTTPKPDLNSSVRNSTLRKDASSKRLNSNSISLARKKKSTIKQLKDLKDASSKKLLRKKHSVNNADNKKDQSSKKPLRRKVSTADPPGASKSTDMQSLKRKKFLKPSPIPSSSSKKTSTTTTNTPTVDHEDAGSPLPPKSNTPCDEEKKEPSIKEVKATKFNPPEGRDKDRSREDNELSDIEAEKPAREKEKITVKNGGRFSIADKTFEIVEGYVQGDYGSCIIKDVSNPSELLTFRYETINAKCKRIKIECTVQVLAAATQRSHILRLLLRGSIDNFQLKYMITDALGIFIPEALKTLSTPHFSTVTALRLSYETLECIEDIHKIGYIHRDVKPMSFAFGLNPNHTKLYVTNFGLAKRYRADMKILPARKTVPFMGTIKYASRATHERSERARKDDLESWIFMINEFADENVLKWRKITKMEEIYQEKQAFMSKDGFSNVCIQYKNIPEEFRPLMHYVLSLEFSTSPDYSYMKKILRESMDKRNIAATDLWEWQMTEEQKTEIRKSSKACQKIDFEPTQQQTMEEQ